jgi:hypothetical protein
MPANHAYAGVSFSSSGLSVYRVNRAAAAVEVFHGLSDDGLWGLITADSSAPPVVYLHRPYSQLQVSCQNTQLAFCCCFRIILGLEWLFGLITANSSAPPVVYLHRPYSQLQISHARVNLENIVQ